MDMNNLNNICDILHDAIISNKYKEDIYLIQKIYNQLNSFDSRCINLEKLDMIKTDINYLEEKYNHDLELLYYYDPFYISVKKELHREQVNQIRRETKRKKEGK